MRLPLLLTAAMIFAALAPLSQADDANATIIKDATGDVALDLFADGMVPAVDAPALASAVDITSLTIGNEDDEGFDLVLQLADLAPEQDQVAPGFAGVSYAIHFGLTGSPFEYTLSESYQPFGDFQWDFQNEVAPSVGPAIYAGLSAAPAKQAKSSASNDTDPNATAGEEDYSYAYGRDVASLKAVADYDKNTITVRVPRAALERAGAGDSMEAPLAADQLTNIVARSFAWFPGPVSDRAPDKGDGASFTFAVDSANNLLRLGWPADAPPAQTGMGPGQPGPPPSPPSSGSDHKRAEPTPYKSHRAHPFAVTPGAPTGIVLELQNRAAAERGVKVRAFPAEGSEGFGVHVAGQVPLQGGEAKLVRLVVTQSRALDHGTKGAAIVEASSASGDVARISVPLIASAGPSAEANVLHLHSAPYSEANPVLNALDQQFDARNLWVNALASDPKADDGPVQIAGLIDMTIQTGTIWIGGYQGEGASTDAPLARPLALDGSPIDVSVGLRATQAAKGTVKVALYQGQTLVAKGEKAADLSGDQVIALTLQPTDTTFAFKDPGVPERFGLSIGWKTDSLTPAPAQFSVSAADLFLLPKGTTVTLPLDAKAEQDAGPLVMAEPEHNTALNPSVAATQSVLGLPLGIGAVAVAIGVGLVWRRRKA